ncbi:hypothetical protein SAMN05660831_02440 [Thiohalospira halophila DSM 15071]|uniref:Uncharacterized protein n=1 Tax=Thiohalospira halophila DSM 15071 TaxID=1123397 RepID=A0A1I1VQ25_9GAMM|nr:hypothetical protein [Thiohalospira halophila]SFD85137.1 hypothetical protein SAMN05660831_02440 [Thiohalospira halophila DSM 15071]
MADVDSTEPDDLSEGQLPEGEVRLWDFEISERTELLEQRRILFRSIGGIVVVMLLALLCYIFLGTATSTSERVTIVVVLAAIPTVLALALLRYVFARNAQDQNQRDDTTPIQALARELVALLPGKS